MLSDNIIFKSATVLLFTSCAYSVGNTLLKKYYVYTKNENDIDELKVNNSLRLPINTSICLYSYLAYKMSDKLFNSSF
jgi:hypothetical protein